MRTDFNLVMSQACVAVAALALPRFAAGPLRAISFRGMPLGRRALFGRAFTVGFGAQAHEAGAIEIAQQVQTYSAVCPPARRQLKLTAPSSLPIYGIILVAAWET